MDSCVSHASASCEQLCIDELAAETLVLPQTDESLDTL
jgi:hypothetical protein